VRGYEKRRRSADAVSRKVTLDPKPGGKTREHPFPAGS
jgi:hypothetical protein